MDIGEAIMVMPSVIRNVCAVFGIPLIYHRNILKLAIVIVLDTWILLIGHTAYFSKKSKSIWTLRYSLPKQEKRECVYVFIETGKHNRYCKNICF